MHCAGVSYLVLVSLPPANDASGALLGVRVCGKETAARGTRYCSVAKISIEIAVCEMSEVCL